MSAEVLPLNAASLGIGVTAVNRFLTGVWQCRMALVQTHVHNKVVVLDGVHDRSSYKDVKLTKHEATDRSGSVIPSILSSESSIPGKMGLRKKKNEKVKKKQVRKKD
jgi:hypothetical protein